MKQRRFSTTRGFAQASGLLQSRIRGASEARGFAVTRLLTHWAEIVGEDTARIAQPVKVGYGRDGLGATLTLLTTGAQAPMLSMQCEAIRERVNACYGYRAIAKVRITQIRRRRGRLRARRQTRVPQPRSGGDGAGGEDRPRGGRHGIATCARGAGCQCLLQASELRQEDP